MTNMDKNSTPQADLPQKQMANKNMFTVLGLIFYLLAVFSVFLFFYASFIFIILALLSSIIGLVNNESKNYRLIAKIILILCIITPLIFGFLIFMALNQEYGRF